MALIAFMLIVSPISAQSVAPFKIEIADLNSANLGDTISVPVYKIAGSEDIHGFDFLVGYDTTILDFLSATPSFVFDIPGPYEWEYFTYRAGIPACTTNCPGGMARFVSLADILNGPHHPVQTLLADSTPLFAINFRVKMDSTVLCNFSPIRFFWIDCGDNVISYPEGVIEKLAISDTIFDFQGMNITNINHDTPSYYGSPMLCVDTTAPNPARRFIEFKNGGVGTMQPECYQSFMNIGDLNLNAIPYEIGDAVLFNDYFLMGLSAFTIDPNAQIDASDTRHDNIPLTPEDYVCLSSVISGRLMPFPNHPPMTMEEFDGILGIVETDSSLIIRSDFDDSVSALHLCFFAPGFAPESSYVELKGLWGLDTISIWGFIHDDSLKIFVADYIYNADGAIISAGLSDLIEIVFGALPKPAFVYAAAGGFWGQHVNLSVAALPNLAPVFDNAPVEISNSCFDGFYYDFDAHDPNIPPDDIEYHIISGPGEINPITGEWTFMPLCLDTGSSSTLVLCASDIAYPCPQTDTTFYAYVQIVVDTFPPVIGDANQSGYINILDITILINYLYKSGPAPEPVPDVMDVNGDNFLNILDVTYLINFLYKGGAEPTCNGQEPMGSLFYYSTCKDTMPTTKDPDSLQEDCITYLYDPINQTLDIMHYNAILNCCPFICANYYFGGDTIIIEEIDSLLDGGCDCICNFDIGYRFSNILSKIYVIQILKPYRPEGEPVFECAIDLLTTQEGYFCIDRPYLPWQGVTK
jgi:hypothetical protein